MMPGQRMVLVAVLVAGSALAVLPAHAAVPAASDDQLVLSTDGSTWAPGITTPLLDPGLVWVPGDVMTSTLYARNVSGESASAVITVHLGGGSEGAGYSLVDELNVRTRMGAAPWTDGTTSVITDLPPGERLPIGIEVELDPAATSALQQRTTWISMAVTLSAVGPGEDGGGGPGEGAPGSLPRPGADLLVAVLVAAGAVALGMRLRRRARHDWPG
ncbi:hypothetical protein ACFT2C_09520 [Promicromonospora sp. NPDC057138]|uniref:hypothetical protein n=1 Tax=Promicromonospora sp. NPDC057138 TaxID=3346031 RepID=UPI00362EBD58